MRRLLWCLGSLLVGLSAAAELQAATPPTEASNRALYWAHGASMFATATIDPNGGGNAASDGPPCAAS